ncbi:MAG: YARHG domain-containing protein [Lachnoclostridium sp.]|nr:YARHG domain-containing protein [Lachnospiraceae bacterium]MCM1249499.1 YARHG domain-containing protein [Lachnoclostridium sp.]
MSKETKMTFKKKPMFFGIAACAIVCIAAVCFLLYFQKSSNSGENLEAYDSVWPEDKIMEELNKRKPYWEACSFYGEIVNYAENVVGIRDISMHFAPLFDTDSLYYSADDFRHVPALVIQLAEYEIYARHGCKFKEEDWNRYFMGQLWYVPVTAQDEFDDTRLNEFEKKNLALLQGLDVEALKELPEEYYYIKAVGDNSLILDDIEWITDEKRAAEIGHENDMPGGFYIYNEEESPFACFFAEACSFTILENHYYPPKKVDKQTFLEGIDGAEFLPPYLIQIENGKIISVTEQYVP